MIAYCYCARKGGGKGQRCEWTAEHRLATRLHVLAEEHRKAEHPWVKPGACHWIEADALEYILDNQPAR